MIQSESHYRLEFTPMCDLRNFQKASQRSEVSKWKSYNKMERMKLLFISLQYRQWEKISLFRRLNSPRADSWIYNSDRVIRLLLSLARTSVKHTVAGTARGKLSFPQITECWAEGTWRALSLSIGSSAFDTLLFAGIPPLPLYCPCPCVTVRHDCYTKEYDFFNLIHKIIWEFFPP